MHKNRHVHHWNQTDDENTNPLTHDFLNQNSQIKIGKKTASSKSQADWKAVYRRIQTEPSLSTCTELKFKRIKDFKIKPQTLNLIEDKVGNNLRLLGKGKEFLNSVSLP